MPGLSSTIGLKRFIWAIGLQVGLSIVPACFGAAADSNGPICAKARKSFDEAVEWERRGEKERATESYRKANKQDGGHCATCLTRAYALAIEAGDDKAAQAVVADQMPLAQNDLDRADLHFRLALALQREGIKEKKDSYLTESCDELRTALALDPGYARVHYLMGVSLAWLHKDSQARDEFNAFLSQGQTDPVLAGRARRFAERVELARARMCPAFTATTFDGRRISLDNLVGKVVLIDFWATWCPPCIAALPHIKEIAHRFEGRPLVVVSVSFDDDDSKWRAFVEKNQMTWVQIRDGRFDGPLAHAFDIRAIPATLTIDADGVLEDQHEGNAAIDEKIKQLVEQAEELAHRKVADRGVVKDAGAGND
jgi:thiol-disulfide isomerase/thioredoxin